MDFNDDVTSAFGASRNRKNLSDMTREEIVALKNEAKEKMERLEQIVEASPHASQRLLFATALGIERSLYADLLVLLDSPGVGLTKWALAHYTLSRAMLMEVAEQGLKDALKIKAEQGGRL